MSAITPAGFYQKKEYDNRGDLTTNDDERQRQHTSGEGKLPQKARSTKDDRASKMDVRGEHVFNARDLNWLLWTYDLYLYIDENW